MGKLIHPIIMYPFRQPGNNENLNTLTTWIEDLDKHEEFSKPVIVVNRQTFYSNVGNEIFDRAYSAFRECGTVIDAWCVDTCQMWLSGLGHVYDSAEPDEGDVFWIIPGDFEYSSDAGRDVLNRLQEIPRKVFDGPAKLCIGEIKTSRDDSKEMIDTYSTYGLLYNWFPVEAKELRRQGFRKPRSEFFALTRSLLRLTMVDSRWFAYEQTLILLLAALGTKRQIDKVILNKVKDYSGDRDNPSSALQQAERTERVLKLYWRKCKEERGEDWGEEYERFSRRSAHIIDSAKVIFEEALACKNQTALCRGATS